MIPDADVRARWIAATKAYERLTVSFRLLLAASNVAEEHAAKRGLLGSLIAVRLGTHAAAVDLLDVDLSYGGDAFPVEWLLPDIIDIESEEDEDHRTAK